ncbi:MULTISPECIES: hypothetical protein [Alphaproteobacteria]|uniref:Uncharacterized protein n=2 Tax=Alphaproteobacteria TaxID=28211 RepID=A0A512HP56_9HYPH|nr:MULTISPECIES: hypothetical protein [Alphaproteobacteria]GEO87232.1 hypothetical protein RNA01_41640 [Ciceribacter naphthalenivorans]GLR23038.1 hypothetical protein GCM10007920_28260 [Ciceribacter naphthalenivorans]GLT05894.1 hypothetical protein GCM10007926_28260 [Sphingomonas psychrolutea]
MRFVLRLVSFAALCIAIVAAAMDSIASVSVSQVVVTPLRSAWVEIAPVSLAWLRTLVEVNLGPTAWRMLEVWFLPQPAFAIFLAVALLLWMAGYRKPSLAGRFAA